MGNRQEWLEEWARKRPKGSGARGTARKASAGKEAGDRPAWLTAVPGGGSSAKLEAAAAVKLDRSELERLCSALAAIPANCSYSEWVMIGMALH